jgi:hypothetical protein
MWLYKEKLFDENINEYEGFVYCITNLINQKKYIGKKHFWSRIKQKNKNRKITKESDWKNYFGSCEELLKDIADLGEQNFKREILFLCIFKKEMTFLEEKLQWENNVLLNDGWYNTCIGGKYFVREKHIYSAIHREITKKNNKWKEIRSKKLNRIINDI